MEVAPHGVERPAPACHLLVRPAARRHRVVALGPTALEREARHDGGHGRGIEAVEPALAQRLRDDELTLAVETRQQSARVGQRPILDVAPGPQHAEHAIELARQALAARGHLPLQTRDSACDPICLPGGAQCRVDAGGVVQRMGRDFRLQRFDVAVRVDGQLRILHLQPAQRLDRCFLERLAPGRERTRQIDRRDLAELATEVVGGQAHERLSLGQREDSLGPAPPLLFQHDHLAAAFGHDQHVSGAKGLEPAVGAAVRGTPRRVELGQQPAVLVRVARGVLGGRLGLCELPAAQLQLAFDRDDVAVGMELRERQVQQVAGLLRWIALHQVHRHVVSRVEGRRQCVGAARGEARDLFERNERIPQHDDVADLVDSPSPGSPRELGVLARSQELVVLTRELRELLDDHRPRGHVDPEGERLRREHHLQQARREPLLHRLLHRWYETRVVGRDAGLHSRQPRVVAQHVEIGVGQRLDVTLRDRAQRSALVRIGEAHPRSETLLDRLVAPGAGEDERDRRKHPLLREPVDDLGSPRLVQASPALAPIGDVAAVEARCHRVRTRLAVVVDECGQEVKARRAPVADEVQVHQVDGPLLLDHRLGRAAQCLHPGCDLLRVGHRRGQRDDVDLGGQVDDHLLPHRASRPVL